MTTIGFLIQGAVLLLGLFLALLTLYGWLCGVRLTGAGERPSWRGFLVSELGAVTVSYFIRGGSVTINGSTTAPTASQATQVNMQKAQVVMGDTDTQFLFTHNWGLDASSPTYFDPEIMLWAQVGNGNTWLTGFTFDQSNTNVLKGNKISSVNSGGTFIVALRRGNGQDFRA